MLTSFVLLPVTPWSSQHCL